MDKKNRFLVVIGIWILWTGTFCWAGTKVGNGDAGGDLEGLEPVSSGVLIKTRDLALHRLDQLHVEGIAGLGNLQAELKNSELFLAKEDVPAALPEDQGTYHANLSGQVYARTFARSHAATRFFPAALKLEESQLIALHIHEALHRALPPEVREDEAKVSQITLALVAPGANHDHVRELMGDLAPMETRPPRLEGELQKQEQVHTEPSRVGYFLRQSLGKSSSSIFPKVRRLHVLYSYLYPFGSDDNALGLGIEASVVEQQDAGVRSGPLGLSGRMRLFSARGFEIDGMARVALNTLSSAELVNSAFGRDIWTMGLSMRKNFGQAYIENALNVNLPGKSERKIGKVTYNYDYGTVVNPLVRFGYTWGAFRMGIYGEMHLASHFKVNGGSFEYDTGRYRILTAGPEVTWLPGDHLMMSVGGRFLVASNKATDLNYIGDIMGVGVEQGGVEFSLGYRF